MSDETLLREIREALERLIAGKAMANDEGLLQDTLQNSQYSIAVGERAVAITGDANGAIIIAGDGNVVYTFRDLDANALDSIAQLMPITWPDLRDSCKNITRTGMSRLPEKSDLEKLYVQRQNVYDQFMRFLDDPETQCFVLIGKSGIGKSSFLLSLAEELQSKEESSQDNNRVILVYDGGRPRGMSFREAVDRDFSQQLRRKIENIWEEINRINGINKYSLILCVDAVNENRRAKELVEHISDLIWERWPWLKILLISRPESWQAIIREIRRETPLADRAYYREKDGTSEVPKELFSYSMEMKPFSREELSQAYDKYRSRYKLQTQYKDLPSRTQEIISDPFHLRIVAESYEGKAIPENLQITTLIDGYVEARIRKGRLRNEDRLWLENQLVPLMIYEEHYKSVITSEELDAAHHLLSRALRGEVDSERQLMLQSFTYLVDADILKREERGSNFEISFKFERFYEHFAGKRILDLSETQKDRYTYLLRMIARTTGDYLLWGAVKNALVLEAKKLDIGVVLKLCRTPDQQVREMMVSVLTTLGADARQQVERILKELVPAPRQTSVIKKLRQWLGKASVDSDLPTRNAGRIAIEVASNLNMPWHLQTAALQGDSRIRAEAARFTYYLWKRDHQAGFMILEHMAQHMTSGVIPDRVALDPTMELSLSILFENYRDEQVLIKLHSIVREVINSIFLTSENVSLKKRIARTVLTPERIFFVLITILNGFVNGLPRYGATFNYGELEEFFSLGTSEKALYKRLVSYIDVEGNYAKQQMEQDFLTVMKQTNNYLIVFIVQLGLIAHTCHSPLTFLPFLQRFFEETKSRIAAYPYMNDVIHVLDNTLHRGPISEELFGFFISALEECQEFYIQHPEAIRNPHYRGTPEVHDLGPYIFHMYRKTGIVEADWLRKRIQNALRPLDVRFFELLLTSELPLIGLERQSPRAALLTVAMFFQFFQDKNADLSVRLEIQKFLAHLKVYYPSEVDDFLEEQRVDKDTRSQIQRRESEENAGALIGQRSLYFLRDYIIIQSTPLKSYLLHVLDKAVDYTDIRVWLNYFLREVINVIYGGEILRLPE